ncbi:hypothetical protein C2E23DRAFT_492303 [Lenzites betulinus]|nr:hypothetical protein C2E23DRAFT_492303 [Lenzites betulinus]
MHNYQCINGTHRRLENTLCRTNRPHLVACLAENLGLLASCLPPATTQLPYPRARLVRSRIVFLSNSLPVCDFAALVASSMARCAQISTPITVPLARALLTCPAPAFSHSVCEARASPAARLCPGRQLSSPPSTVHAGVRHEGRCVPPYLPGIPLGVSGVRRLEMLVRLRDMQPCSATALTFYNRRSVSFSTPAPPDVFQDAATPAFVHSAR